LERTNVDVDENVEARSLRNRSVIIHSIIGLIIGLVLSLASMTEFVESLGPKLWGVLGIVILILLYIPMYFMFRRGRLPSTAGEFLVYLTMGIGSWFSFYPFLLGAIK